MGKIEDYALPGNGASFTAILTGDNLLYVDKPGAYDVVVLQGIWISGNKRYLLVPDYYKQVKFNGDFTMKSNVALVIDQSVGSIKQDGTVNLGIASNKRDSGIPSDDYPMRVYSTDNFTPLKLDKAMPGEIHSMTVAIRADPWRCAVFSTDANANAGVAPNVGYANVYPKAFLQLVGSARSCAPAPAIVRPPTEYSIRVKPNVEITFRNTMGPLPTAFPLTVQMQDSTGQTYAPKTFLLPGKSATRLALSQYHLTLKTTATSTELQTRAGTAVASWPVKRSAAEYRMQVKGGGIASGIGTITYALRPPGNLIPEVPIPAPNPVIISDDTLLILLGVGVAAFVLYRLL